MTQSGHRPLKIIAAQLDPLNPIPPVANPCCNRVRIGVVPALGHLQQLLDEVIE
jgi:hypothetical protein